jgi:acyl-CoA reductase-like NAD-dependent aldehyde dehydrogenase
MFLCKNESQLNAPSKREIFGPILPIIEVEDVDEAIEIINSRYAVVQGHQTRYI